MKNKNSLWMILRITLAAAPFVWIYTRTDAAALAETLTGISVPLVLAITALTVSTTAIQGVKWWILIRRFAPELRLGKAVSVHFESTFYAIALPTGVAQDIVKSVILSKDHDPSAVWAASWLGRLIGLFTMLAYSVFGALYLKSDILPEGFRAALVTAVAVIAVLTAASFSKRITRPLRGVAGKIIPAKILGKIEKLHNGIYAFKRERLVLTQTLLISALIQFLIFFTISLTVYAVSGQFYLIECLAFAPLVEIMTIAIPLTPGGIGIREALMTLLFTQLDFSNEQIASYVTISLLMAMTRVFGVIPALKLNLKK